jgi:outer membrane protein assembly factor BamB
MLKALLVALLLPGCALDSGEGEETGGPDTGEPPDLAGSFKLVTTRSIAGEYPIAGVDTDGQGGLWIAYSIQTGDYYSLDEVRIVHLDAQGTKTKEFVYRDEFTDISGLAFSGDAVWVNYGRWLAGTGNYHIRKLDPETGARLGSFAAPNGIVEIDVHGDELRLSNQWNQIIALDLQTGGEKWRREVSAFEDGGTQRGIASTDDGRLWVASWTTSRIHVLDADGDSVGNGRTELLERGHTVHVGLQLAWDGAQLIMVANHQIHWLAPR